MSAPGAFRNNLAVVIGIDAYGSGLPPLRSAVNDARRVAEILAADHGFTVQSLFDAQASRQALLDLLTRRLPAAVGPDDRVVFYYAGHGVAVDGDDGPDGFILPQDAVRGDSGTYFAMTRLHDALEALPCRHMLVVLDSCFSGTFRWSSLRDVMTTPGVVHQERYDRFVHDPAWQVLTSAAYDQTAADQLLSGSLGSRGDTGLHSPFALALFEGLAGAADLAPAGGDGIITATELYLYLEERLQVETLAQKRRQTPGLWPLRKHDKGEFVFLVPGREPRLPPAPPLTYANNPYRGLASYNQEDAEIFFGRAAAVNELSARVAARPVTVVLGASGTGKSSVVKAGAVPRLEGGGWKALPVVRPGAAPFEALANALSAGDSRVASSAEAIRQAIRERLDTAGQKTLLVVDQFEELVTLTRSPETREAFVNLLADLAALDDPRLRIILTLRTDFEAHFDRTRLRELWHAGRFVVPPMSRQDYRAVIEGPASHRVVYFEPSSLVDTLLDDVSAMPGGLPLLSFTLSEMYRRYVERDSDDRALTRQDYEDLGGVAGALRSRADAEVAALDAVHQATLRRLMLRMLVVEQGTLARQRVTRAELAHWDPVESARIGLVLSRLSEARLVVEGVGADGVAYVEPAHDALVTSWGRLLEWTHEAQGREPDLHFLHALARTAQDWAAATGGARAGLLWRDKVRSGRLWALRKSGRVQFNQDEDQFCSASVARRRFVRNGLAALVAAVVVAGVVATGLGVVADQQRVVALAQRNEAQRQTRAAWSSTLTAKAAIALDNQRDPTTALKLAAVALKADPSNVPAAMLVRRAMYGAGLFEYRGHWYATPPYRTVSPSATAVSWSLDGSLVAVSGYDSEKEVNVVEVFGMDGSRRGGWSAGTYDAAPPFSYDGKFILDGNDPPSAWTLDGRPVSRSFAATLRPAPRPVAELAWEATAARGFDYRTAVTPDGQARAGQAVERFVAARGGWEPSPEQRHDVAMPGMTQEEWTAWGPFAVMRRDRVIATLPGDWVRTALTWDGRYVATGSLEGTTALWRIDEDSQQAVHLGDLWTGSAQVSDLAFSPDGSRLAACAGACRVWHLTAYPLATTAHPEPGAQLRARFQEDAPTPTTSPDGLTATLTSRGDYEASLVVEDPQAGTRWTRQFGTVDTTAALLADGLVAASDTDRLWLIESRGIEQATLPIPAFGLATTPDRNALLILRYDPAKVALVLPVAPADLIEIAQREGHVAMLPAEIERWDIGDILSGLDTMAEQPKADVTLWSLVAGPVRELFAPAAASSASVDPWSSSESVAAPEAWSALGPEEPDERGAGSSEWLADIRTFLQDARDGGAIAAVLKMGGPAPFLEGPHQGDQWDLQSETFGTYNPAFVQWLAAALVPGSRDAPLRRVTQVFYDRHVQRVARIHALALAALDENPELRSSVAASYAGLREGRGPHLIAALAPVVDAVGPTPEGEPKDVAEAAGFWVRRELDGSAPDFRRGLERLLGAYDSQFLAREAIAASAAAALDTPGPLAWAFWSGAAAPPCAEQRSLALGFDARLSLCAMQRDGVLQSIAAAAAMPIFRSGPHKGIELDVRAPTFGYYNPAFVRWASDTLVPAPAQTTLIALTGPIYARVARDAVRACYLALKAVTANPAIVDPLLLALQGGAPPEVPLRQAAFEIQAAPPARIVGEAMRANFDRAVSFWLRRSVDGTREDFAVGLRRVLRAYDADFLAAQGGGAAPPVTPPR